MTANCSDQDRPSACLRERFGPTTHKARHHGRFNGVATLQCVFDDLYAAGLHDDGDALAREARQHFPNRAFPLSAYEHGLFPIFGVLAVINAKPLDCDSVVAVVAKP